MSALRTGTLVAVLLVNALLPGCRRPAERQVSDTVTLAVRADVTGFFPNPPMANEGYTQEINWNILEGLSGFDGGYRLVPALAGRWHNPDPRTYVFELRPGLLFSDGRPVTANDVVASLRAHKERPWVFSDFLQAIETVDVDSEGRIVIHTRSP